MNRRPRQPTDSATTFKHWKVNYSANWFLSIWDLAFLVN